MLFHKSDDFELYNGDCIDIMKSLPDGCADIVITSPPYGTCRNESFSQESIGKRKYNMRYDAFVENKSPEEYMLWTVEVFDGLSRMLKQNRIVLYNFGLGNDGHTDFTNCDWFKTISYVCEHTDFTVADLLFWKKKSALPNNVSQNKSTRIVEPVIVFCRKDEIMSFKSNKKQCSAFKTGQKLYSPFYNIFEARNNDGSNDLNKATYSTQFVDTLINMYCPDDERHSWTALDPFSGTGTTGLSALSHGMKYIGIELSEQQCGYTLQRLSNGIEAFLF